MIRRPSSSPLFPYTTLFRSNFGGIVPVDYHPVTNPVGAGPYKLKSFTPGQRSLFTRFENYYKEGKPYADELEIIDFKDQVARLAALRSGQIDMANVMPTEQLPILQQDPRLKVIKSVTGNWLSFDMNLDKPPFNDPRVREAFRLMLMTLDRTRRALNGQGLQDEDDTRLHLLHALAGLRLSLLPGVEFIGGTEMEAPLPDGAPL